MPLRRFTQAELVLTQRLHLERPLLVLVLLGAAILCLADGRLLYLLVAGAAVSANALALARRSELYVPRWMVNLGGLACTGVFLIDFWNNASTLVSLGHYLILIQVCKLFEQKRNGDYGQMLSISVVLVIATAMVTSGLWYAILLACYVPLLMYVCMLLSLKIALDKQASARLAVESRPVDPHQVAWDVSASFPRGGLWRKAIGGSLAIALMAAGVFLLMPRGRLGMIVPLPEGKSGGDSMTGFPNSIHLNEVGRITQDPRVVMRVEISQDGRNLGPTGFQAYLRGRVYDTYSQGEWALERGRLAWFGGRPVLRDLRLESEHALVQKITLDSSVLPVLFAVAPVVHVDLPEGTRITGGYPDLYVERGSEELPMEYTVQTLRPPYTPGQLDYLRQLIGHGGGPRTMSSALPVPARIAALAREWCSDLAGGLLPIPAGQESVKAPRPAERTENQDMAIAQRILDRLRGAPFSYTLDLSQIEPDRDPVEQFLFETHRGHCEFFASAMTLMCRAMGVRARLAGGFVADDYSSSAQAYLVRARDAHAWVEVYGEQGDWVIFDPTPPGAGAEPAGEVRNFWDSLKFMWGSRVIGYNEFDRERLFGGFLRAFEACWRGIAKVAENLGRQVWNLLTGQDVRADWSLGAGVLVVGVGLPLTALVLLRLRRRRRLPDMATWPEFYRRLVRRLARQGVRPLPHQTPREYLQGLAGASVATGAVEQLWRLAYRVRWGGAAMTEQEGTRANELADQLAAAVRQDRRARCRR